MVLDRLPVFSSDDSSHIHTFLSDQKLNIDPWHSTHIPAGYGGTPGRAARRQLLLCQTTLTKEV